MLISRTLLPVFAVGLLFTSCRFGMDYSGDETGLVRASIPVEGHPDRELSYLIHGDATKPRVIFIHGSPGLSQMYVEYLHELEDKAEVIAVDRLGYGGSAGSGVVASFEEQAAAIAPLLVQRDGLWPIVVGHSLGGPIATQLAADYPDKVGALINVAGGLDPELENPRWYNEVAGWRIMTPFIADFLNVSNKEMWACREQVELLDARLDHITCPVAVIHGTSDHLVPFEAVEHSIERLTKHNANVWVMVLIGEDHSITKLRREEVRETIEEFLDGLKNLVEDAR